MNFCCTEDALDSWQMRKHKMNFSHGKGAWFVTDLETHEFLSHTKWSWFVEIVGRNGNGSESAIASHFLRRSRTIQLYLCTDKKICTAEYPIIHYTPDNILTDWLAPWSQDTLRIRLAAGNSILAPNAWWDQVGSARQKCLGSKNFREPKMPIDIKGSTIEKIWS